jgi:hypothetical protein
MSLGKKRPTKDSDDFLFLLTVWPGSVDGIWTALLFS